MKDIARETARLWVAILVGWALTLAAWSPPASAVAGETTALGVLCSEVAKADLPARDHADHGTLCCVLCSISGFSAVIPVGSPVATSRVEVAGRPLPYPPSASPRASPGAFPVNPRAPPAAA